MHPKGAIIFIIDPNGNVLSGFESNFESKDLKGKKYIYGPTMLKLNDVNVQEDLVTRLYNLYFPGRADVLIPPTFRISTGQDTEKEINKSLTIPGGNPDESNIDALQRLTRVNQNDVLYKVQPRVINHGSFGVPKGELNPGEIPEDCALRELREEVGWNPGPGRLNNIHHQLSNGYQVFYLRVNAQESADILSEIQRRTQAHIGEMFNVGFNSLRGKKLNNPTKHAYKYLSAKDLMGNPRVPSIPPDIPLQGGKHYSYRSKSSTKRRRTHRHKKTRRRNHRRGH